MVRRHTDQMFRTRNFKVRNERIETGVLVKTQGRMSALRGKLENAINGKQKDSVQKEMLAVSATTTAQSSSLAPRSQTQNDGSMLSNGETSKTVVFQKETVRIRRVMIGILSYVKVTKSALGCKSCDKFVFRHTEVDSQPSKKQKKSCGKGSFALLKISKQLCCVFQETQPPSAQKGGLESVGELSTVCSQIVLKCQYLARIGRPDSLWSVSNEMDKSMWQKLSSFDLLHSSHE